MTLALTAETRKFLRITLLRTLNAGSRLGIPFSGVGGITTAVRINPTLREVDDATLRREMDYLLDGSADSPALAAEVPQTISPELTSYRITKAGRDWLATNGLDG